MKVNKNNALKSPLLVALKLVLIVALLSSYSWMVVAEEEARPEPPQEEEAVQNAEENEASPSPEATPNEGTATATDEGGPDDSLFELNIYECVAPKGDPSPHSNQPKTRGGIVTLCFKPAQEEAASIKSIFKMENLAIGVPERVRQDSVWRNDAIDEKTQVVCPIENSNMCVAAAKLMDDFFKESHTVQATGEATIQAAGETRTVPFSYEFETLKAPPGSLRAGEIEHEFFEMPETPPGFPMANEIRMFLLGALILTLLEFAFTPSKDTKSSSKSNDSSSKNKAKSKKE